MGQKVEEHGFPGFKFIFHNQEARDWYQPIKDYTFLEYDWVRKNVPLGGETVIDAGCHHGHYAVVFKPAFVIAVDNQLPNLRFCYQNMKLNEVDGVLMHDHLGRNGVQTDRKPGVYKMDIEGAEFQLLPWEIDRFPSVHTWIIEMHPWAGICEVLASYFRERDFDLLKVDREQMLVRSYVQGEQWATHATLIARKEG